MQTTNKFKAAIFDMDGVLVDNHSFHLEAFIVFAKKYGYELTEDEFNSRIVGKTNKAILEDVFPHLLEKNTVAFYEQEKEGMYRDLFRPFLKPTPGLVELLKLLKQEGIKIAVATNAPVENIEFTLKGIEIESFFDEIIEPSMVVSAKPAPDIYLKAAEKLGIHADNCIVFEDSLTGIKAGQNAGMKVIGLATSLPAEKLSHTDLVINDFTNLSFEKLTQVIL